MRASAWSEDSACDDMSPALSVMTLGDSASVDGKPTSETDAAERTLAVALSDAAERTLAVALSKYEEGERGLSEIAQHVLKDVLKRVGSKGEIYYFKPEDCRWSRGDETSVLHIVSYAVEDALRALDAYFACRASEVAASEARKKVAACIRFVQRRAGMANVTTLTTRLCQDDGFDQRLDSKPHLLGVRNGVVDLRSGQLRARKPEDMIYAVLEVEYDPEASTALVEETVLSIMADDASMAAYLQKLLGYGITGEVCEEIFAVWTASGRNGKGLLMQGLMALLKTMYVELNCGIIVARQVSNLDAERGKLLGARLAVFNELEAGERLKRARCSC
jgi:putative DNA primase/helicase